MDWMHYTWKSYEKDDTVMSRFQLVVGIILATREPLSVYTTFWSRFFKAVLRTELDTVRWILGSNHVIDGNMNSEPYRLRPSLHFAANMFFQNAQNTDARHSQFTVIHGDVYNSTTPLTELNGFCVPNASWDPQHVCLHGTRTSLIHSIDSWVNQRDKETPRSFLVTGVVGSGKSSLAHTLAQRFHERGHLASSFFFNRSVSGRDNASQLFTTIARDLAAIDPTIRNNILQKIREVPSLLSAPIARQFHELIYLSTNDVVLTRPAVVVIDALDESGNRAARQAFLSILRGHLVELPPFFRIILTARPEEDILEACGSRAHFMLHHIDIRSEANTTDLSIYLKHRLSVIARAKSLGCSWPGGQIEGDLGRRAEGLFVWASTACSFVEQSLAPMKQLKLLLSERPSLRAEQPLHSLYLMALEYAHDWEDQDFVSGFQLIVGAIMVAKIPLSSLALTTLHHAVLSELWNEDTLTAADFIKPLGCLFSGIGDRDDNVPIQALHSSLHDFLTTRALCRNDMFHINQSEHNSRMASLCLELMTKGLKYNICCLDDPSIPIPQYSDDVLTTHISEALQYSCRFWISLRDVAGHKPLVRLSDNSFSHISCIGRRL
jgi:hypothetical protein